MNKAWHQMNREEICTYFELDPEHGLHHDEVLERREIAGTNELSEGKRVSPITLFLQQFKDFMVLVLAGATLISGVLGEYLDAITIMVIILLNGVLGFIQEFRAERSLRALKQMAAPTTKVVRNKRLEEVASSELVPGDVVFIASGDRIPADIRWIEVNSLYVEESTLTGESVSVSKHSGILDERDVPLGELKNLGFMGTSVTRGTATGIVVGTGMNTEMGKIADLIQSTESKETPLQRRLEQLGKILIVLALALTSLVVVAGIMHGQPTYAMFLAGVTLAVAAIPEGLPAIVTIALAIGVQRMIRRKAIVRKLPSVETLGCASIICSDKTGTLTQNKMTVTRLWCDGRLLEVSGEGFDPHGNITYNGSKQNLRTNSTLRRLLQISVLCNNAQLYEKSSTNGATGWSIQGDPTEGALVVLAAKANVTRNSLENMYTKQLEFPFEADRKRMSVIVEHQGGKLALVKGAPDLLLEQCTTMLLDGKIVPLTPALRAKVRNANETMARSALRVLGMAYKDIRATRTIKDASEAECDLVFVGLAGMIDPPRSEVKDAIYTCRKAGIKTVMITGDHELTATAIASQLGMIPASGLSLNGRQLDQMTDEQLDKQIEQTYVYARVSPEHKLRIVRALQNRGHVVAMTGDGVNDAPAVKAADIGIAMGVTGTDVTKEASSLILSDDNFATIVSAIEEGRGIYENIRKFIRYLLASNVGEILVMLFAMLLGMPLPLVPIQILWVNLVTDGLPAMALGVDQAEGNLMEQKPRDGRESIFARRLGWKIVSRGFLIGLCTLAAFWITLKGFTREGADLTLAQTVAFSTLVMAQLIHVFDCRSSRSIFHRNLFENKYLIAAVISSLILLFVVIYIEPLQPIFKTIPLGWSEWILIGISAGIPTFLMGFGSIAFGSKPKRKTFRYTPSHPPIK